MLLTALSKGVAYGLLLNRRSANGHIPEYERVGFVNGQDVMGEITKWTSSWMATREIKPEPVTAPLFMEAWEPDEHEGIDTILEEVSISKSIMKIW